MAEMYRKLGEMETILTRGRTEVMADERKSGVTAGGSIPPVTGGGVPEAVQKALAGVGPGVHTLSDGSRWKKDQNGSIVRQ
jgi:hypothetical protein